MQRKPPARRPSDTAPVRRPVEAADGSGSSGPQAAAAVRGGVAAIRCRDPGRRGAVGAAAQTRNEL